MIYIMVNLSKGPESESSHQFRYDITDLQRNMLCQQKKISYFISLFWFCIGMILIPVFSIFFIPLILHDFLLGILIIGMPLMCIIGSIIGFVSTRDFMSFKRYQFNRIELNSHQIDISSSTHPDKSYTLLLQHILRVQLSLVGLGVYPSQNLQIQDHSPKYALKIDLWMDQSSTSSKKVIFLHIGLNESESVQSMKNLEDIFENQYKIPVKVNYTLLSTTLSEYQSSPNLLKRFAASQIKRNLPYDISQNPTPHQFPVKDANTSNLNCSINSTTSQKQTKSPSKSLELPKSPQSSKGDEISTKIDLILVKNHRPLLKRGSLLLWGFNGFFFVSFGLIYYFLNDDSVNISPYIFIFVFIGILGVLIFIGTLYYSRQDFRYFHQKYRCLSLQPSKIVLIPTQNHPSQGIIHIDPSLIKSVHLSLQSRLYFESFFSNQNKFSYLSIGIALRTGQFYPVFWGGSQSTFAQITAQKITNFFQQQYPAISLRISRRIQNSTLILTEKLQNAYNADLEFHNTQFRSNTLFKSPKQIEIELMNNHHPSLNAIAYTDATGHQEVNCNPKTNQLTINPLLESKRMPKLGHYIGLFLYSMIVLVLLYASITLLYYTRIDFVGIFLFVLTCALILYFARMYKGIFQIHRFSAKKNPPLSLSSTGVTYPNSSAVHHVSFIPLAQIRSINLQKLKIIYKEENESILGTKYALKLSINPHYSPPRDTYFMAKTSSLDCDRIAKDIQFFVRQVMHLPISFH